MSSTDPLLDQRLKKRLMLLDTVPPRDIKAADQGRRVYLTQAEALRGGVSELTRASQLKTGILKEHSQGFLQRLKSQPTLAIRLASIVIILAFLLGGTGMVVYAAQSSLPGDVLYGVKTLSEDVRLGFTKNPQVRLALNLEYTDRRAQETDALLQAGKAPYEPGLKRMEAELDQALGLAAELNDSDLSSVLIKIQNSLIAQDKALRKAEKLSSPHLSFELNRVREKIQTRIKWVEDGLENPNAFRSQFQQHGPTWLGETSTLEPNRTPGNGYGPGGNPNRTPGSFDPGSFSTGTPTPNVYEPDPQSKPERTPAGRGRRTPNPGGRPGHDKKIKPGRHPGM